MLKEGYRVRTLTNSMSRVNPFAGQVKAQLTDRAREHVTTLSLHYASELARWRSRQEAYERL